MKGKKMLLEKIQYGVDGDPRSFPRVYPGLIRKDRLSKLGSSSYLDASSGHGRAE